ncbi:MAG: NTP transferase domain-containing protein [Cellulophaga sp.]|uniref:NTP transferase domain-containing protein n=1 Tax=unclassified Cellulophaga TaxID=2634405 RepID=UPI0026E37BE8|nr:MULTISPECIES: NTP transferase domain-containing protein [unclassified Cellulophaga]MDO6491660.1 NTP transferase domain-containing protein [Cellulophaga sp. 2_MG-2023]MDO6493537.1 NTP transferase domain-containing protein [Cellulophaga sp. 3_MG-2023]
MKKTQLYGLVLAGGKSTRMGTDKGAITYHNIPQRDYVYNLLDQVCDATFYSIREDQQTEFTNDNVIVDKNDFKGPYNGLLSAYKHNKNVAWLVVACDLPLLNIAALEQLKQERDNTKLATAFATTESKLPEPLCAIWEPNALKTSVDYLNEGNGSCPRKFLINNANVKLVYPEQDQVLLNANSKGEYKVALQKIEIQLTK